ncbi:hypothetical protein H7Y63_02945 [Polaromonas sp.]|nr:hypothetical protein [Candidatus Saccharibacteria bacterium]
MNQQKKLDQLQISIELCNLMIDALERMDEQSAASLEVIIGNLYRLGLLKNKETALPFEGEFLSGALISEYIFEKKNGAVKQEDFSSYNFNVADAPSVELIRKARIQLEEKSKEITASISVVNDKKIAELMKSNSKWRER